MGYPDPAAAGLEMTASLVAHFPQYDTGINATETERVAHYVIQFCGPAMVWDNVEIAGGIRIFVIDRRRDPLPI